MGQPPSAAAADLCGCLNPRCRDYTDIPSYVSWTPPAPLGLIGDPRLTFKLCITLLLSVLSGKLVTRIARPGATLRSIILMLGIVPVLLIAAGIVELCVVPHALWGQRLIGSNAIHCLKSIPFLAAVPLVSVLLALRQGAPEHPAWAGAAAGLFAGAVGAAFYATHCPDDSPLFVAAWYTLAIVFVTAIGALGGARVTILWMVTPRSW